VAPIIETVEIARGPEDVFDYVADLSRHAEWQDQIVSVRVDTDGPTRVGSRATETRRVPGGPREFTYEMTEFDRPSRASFRGLNGPIRPVGTMTIEPSANGSRVTLQLDFEGHGVGRLLLPLVRMDARRQVPQDQAQLKSRLETSTQ
jgi:uncharacterized protein YndB with AHSA1/START domain